MELTTLTSAMALGMLGTAHCIGMCGPLVLAFPSRVGGFGAHLYYHAGRILTYTLLGILLSGLGVALARLSFLVGADYLTVLARIQVLFALIAAVFLLILGLAQLGIIAEPSWMRVAAPTKIPGARSLLHMNTGPSDPARMFFTGMLMGFLPCGLSFAALARALALDHPLAGGLLLLVFGLSTLPGLMFLGGSASLLVRRYQRQFTLLAGLLMMVMSVSMFIKVLSSFSAQ
jgi:sulfite exporter TauE/SafE